MRLLNLEEAEKCLYRDDVSEFPSPAKFLCMIFKQLSQLPNEAAFIKNFIPTTKKKMIASKYNKNY